MLGLTLAWIGTACWGVCFWWMHRLSARQETMLRDLHEMTRRIERLSKTEHDLLREMHPAVEKMKGSVEDVVEVHDMHATMLHLLGVDHKKLSFKFQGRNFRLTDVHGNVVKKILA